MAVWDCPRLLVSTCVTSSPVTCSPILRPALLRSRLPTLTRTAWLPARTTVSVALELATALPDSAALVLDVCFFTVEPLKSRTDKRQTAVPRMITATPLAATTRTAPVARRTSPPLVQTPRRLPAPRLAPFLTVARVSTTVSPLAQLL